MQVRKFGIWNAAYRHPRYNPLLHSQPRDEYSISQFLAKDAACARKQPSKAVFTSIPSIVLSPSINRPLDKRCKPLTTVAKFMGLLANATATPVPSSIQLPPPFARCSDPNRVEADLTVNLRAPAPCYSPARRHFSRLAAIPSLEGFIGFSPRSCTKGVGAHVFSRKR